MALKPIAPEQQKILDKLFQTWLDSQRKYKVIQEALVEVERLVLIDESKFKGVVAAFGGEDWQWDGQHVRFINPPKPEQSVKIPRESKAKAKK